MTLIQISLKFLKIILAEFFIKKITLNSISFAPSPSLKFTKPTLACNPPCLIKDFFQLSFFFNLFLGASTVQNFHTKRNPIFHQQEEHPQISLKMIYSIQFFIFLQKNVSEFSKNNSKDNIISVELAQVQKDKAYGKFKPATVKIKNVNSQLTV